ncbi:MAG: hypothetical protein F4026_03855 [Synechococcus sp. SB0669_bin_8]|nr:hypothetical protein [Synechococcus sp. SB0675_bin_6]MYK91275.1 hypothetical protein [Synechococcus sp. SB0669_bin_8]
MESSQEHPHTRCLGPIEGWRTRRLLMALSLQQAGWSLEKIANHLRCATLTLTLTLTLTRDITVYRHSSRSQAAHGMRAALWG